jgi:hypothetical protein
MKILLQIKETIFRFPFVMAACFIGVIEMIVALQADLFVYPELTKIILNIFLVVMLAIPIFISIRLFSESRQIKFNYQLIVNILMTVVFVGVYFLMPENISDTVYGFIYIPIAVAVWSMTFVSAYLNRNGHGDFLKFTQNVIIHGLIYGFLCGVLMFGIMIAVMAIKALFEFSFHPERIIYNLGAVIFGLGLPILILRTVHKKFVGIEEPSINITLVKILSKYILFPLIAVYFLIIYSYAFKIIFTAVWPEGIVATVVLAFIVLALLTMFISYSYYERTRVRHLFTAIFSAIIPMAILLLVAVSVRVSEYGVTESRYFVTLSGIIFIMISIYYLIARTKFNWKFVVIGLAVIAILTTFGPWSAVSMSRGSQLEQLEDEMDGFGLMVDGKVVKPREPNFYIGYYWEDGEYGMLVHNLHTYNRKYGIEPMNSWFYAEEYDSIYDLLKNGLNLQMTTDKSKIKN